MKIQDLVIQPLTLSFVTTYKCTAACENCCFKCSPYRTEKLSKNEMKQYIDTVIEIYP